MIRINRITIRVLDDDSETFPDYLGSFSNTAGEFAIEVPNAKRNRHYLYFNAANVENMVAAKENFIRTMQFVNGEVSLVGTRAEAVIATTANEQEWTSNTITSSGLWGTSSDSGTEYFESIGAEELASLHEILGQLGFTKKMIASAPVVWEGLP